GAATAGQTDDSNAATTMPACSRDRAARFIVSPTARRAGAPSAADAGARALDRAPPWRCG
ncbi:MAG TPA: hypothetical protein VGE12_01410, partial [Noviherbaspirillum sp.]